MKPNRVLCRSLAAALTFLPAVAWGQTTGAITGLTVDPAQATQGNPVTVTVQGEGSCGAIKITFGDGESATVSGTGFPRTVAHTYQSPGSKTLTAVRTDASCRRSATALVTVAESSLARQPSRPSTPTASTREPAGNPRPSAGPARTPAAPYPREQVAEAQREAQPHTVLRFEEARQSAMAARLPGGRIDVESAALLASLGAQYVSSVRIENTRSQDLARRLAQARTEPALSGNQDFELGPSPCPITRLEGAPLEIASVQATPPLDPGEWVLVDGCGLGISPGELRLVGDFPGGHLELQVESWSSRHIHAQLPLVTGVGDMPSARLQVVRHDAKLSSLLDVGGFRATREVRLIHPNDVIVTCAGMYYNNSYNAPECTLAQSHPLSESQFFGGATFAANHVSGAIEEFDYDTTCHFNFSDLAWVSLANGWVLAGYAWGWDHPVGDGYVLPPTGFALNASSATMAIEWGMNICGVEMQQVRYRVDLYAVGPKGVPYK